MPLIINGIRVAGVGANGKNGVGVPSGGTETQVLVKKSVVDYDTTWADLPSIDTTLSVEGQAADAKIVGDYINELNAITANLISTSDVEIKISTHDTSTSAHDDIRALINDLSTAVNNFLDVDDTTTDQLSEVLTLIENNNGTLESLTSSKINVSDIVSNLTTNSTDKVLAAAQGVVIKNLIDVLQIELDALEEVVDTKLGYLDGVTNNIQTQIDTKLSTSDFNNTIANYYTKTEIDNSEFITVDDIDTICGVTIQLASEVTF